MTDMEQILQAIQRLPVRDRLRIIERIAHELIDSLEQARQPNETAAPELDHPLEKPGRIPTKNP